MNFYTKSRFPAIKTLTYINLSSTTNKYNSGGGEKEREPFQLALPAGKQDYPRKEKTGGKKEYKKKAFSEALKCFRKCFP